MNIDLFHGWAMHGGIWAPLQSAMAATGIRLHSPDLPGHGHARECPEVFTLDTLADELAGTLNGSGLVGGWSLGGMVAMNLALRHPGKVRGIILINTTPSFACRDDWQAGVGVDVLSGFTEGLEQDAARTLTRFLSLQLGKNSSADQLRGLRQLVNARPVPEMAVLRDGLRILAETDMRSQLAAIDVPTLIIHGDRDRLAPVAAARWLAELWPQAHLCTIAGAGHAPFLSHPEHVASAVTEFVSTHQEDFS